MSIVTALQAMDNLDRSKYNVIPVYLAKDGPLVYRPGPAGRALL